MLDLILKNLKNHSTKLWLSMTASILLVAYKYLPVSFVPSISPLLTQDKWVLLASLLTILLLALFILLWIKHYDFVNFKKKNKEKIEAVLDAKLTPKYGLLWDRYKNPHCKKCKVLLGPVEEDYNYIYHCHACGLSNYISIDSKQASYEEIRDRI